MEDTSKSPDEPLGVGALSTVSGVVQASFSPDHPEELRKRKADGASSISDSKTMTHTHLDSRNGMQKRPRLGTPSCAPTQMFLAPQDRSRLPAEICHHIFTSLPPRALGNLLRVNKLFNTYLDPSSPFASATQPPRLLQSSVARFMEANEIWKRARCVFWPKMPGPFQGMSELEMWQLACSSKCQFCGKKDTRKQPPSSDPFRYGPGADGVARVWEFRVRCCGSCLSRKTIKEMDFLMSTASTVLMPALQFVFATSSNVIIPLHIIESGKLPPNEVLNKLYWAADVDALREEFATVKEFGAAAADEWQKGLSSRGSRQRAEIAKWQKYDESGGISSMRTLLDHHQKPPMANTQRPTTLQPTASSQSKTASSLSKSIAKTLATAEKTRDIPSPQSAEAALSRDTGAVPAMSREKTTQPLQSGGTRETTRQKTRDEIDAEWDEVQGPVRLNMLKYADEAITGDWDDGEKVTRDNAPSFAADVLLHVRNRFYTDVAKKAREARAAGQRPVVDRPEGPFTQKLTLENMKYVFDVKVKPITGELRQELFLCNDCNNYGKFFGFEGVLQHFAAKHTTAMSQGNIVVYWRAEWPEHSPFKEDPRPPKANAQPVLPAKPPISRNAKLPKAQPRAQHQPASNVMGPGASQRGGPGVTVDHLIGHHAKPRSKVEAIALRSKELWRATANMAQLPPEVRCHTVFFHLNKYFKKQFGKWLSLSQFLESLHFYKDDEMHALWIASFQLPCDACEISLGPNTEKFLLRDLLQHFSDTHITGLLGIPDSSSINWIIDMFNLPSYDTLAKMAGPKGRTYPLLFASIQNLPRTADDDRKLRDEKLTREKWRAFRKRTRAQYLVDELEPLKNGRRQRESSAVVKREPSSGPAPPAHQRVPERPEHAPSAEAARPKASGPDIFGALEQNLDQEPAQDSGFRHEPRMRPGRVTHPRLPQDSRDSVYDDDVQQRQGVVPLEPGYGSVGQGTIARHQTGRVGANAPVDRPPLAQDDAPSSNTAWQEQPVQHWEAAYDAPQLVREADYGSGYDGRGPPQRFQPPPQQYAHAPPPREYLHDGYREDVVRAVPVRVEYEPYGPYEPYEAYEDVEMVRVVHHDGSYLVRRPVRREVAGPVSETFAGRQYYRPVAPQVYEEQAGGQRYAPGYYGAPAGHTAPMYIRSVPGDRAAAPAPAQPTPAHPAPAHHGEPLEEYDPHYPSA